MTADTCFESWDSLQYSEISDSNFQSQKKSKIFFCKKSCMMFINKQYYMRMFPRLLWHFWMTFRHPSIAFWYTDCGIEAHDVFTSFKKFLTKIVFHKFQKMSTARLKTYFLFIILKYLWEIIITHNV